MYYCSKGGENMVTKKSKIKCPKCKTGMIPGRFLNNGMVWTGKEWSDVYEKNVKGCQANPAYGVVAFRCPTCQFIEVYTAEDEKA
jgi:exosome complex RNA-binding protein Csl4